MEGKENVGAVWKSLNTYTLTRIVNKVRGNKSVRLAKKGDCLETVLAYSNLGRKAL